MKTWPHKVQPYSQHEVQEFAVKNDEWQLFRVTLHGLSTEDKLDKLEEFRAQHFIDAGAETFELPRKWQVAIDNYLQALHRGGLVKPNKETGLFEVIK